MFVFYDILLRFCSIYDLLVIENVYGSFFRFDHIILETTGLANPGPVAAVLWVDDQLESPVHLDSIVTVCFECPIQSSQALGT